MAVFLCLLMVGLILRFPDLTIAASRNALRVWAGDIVPSLFPYMVLCKMTALRLQTAHLPIAPMTMLMGWLGGSPSGAAMLSASSDRLTQKQLRALCALTGTISPMFFIGTLQAWGVERKTCLCLLAAHWAGALFAAVCMKNFPIERRNVKPKETVIKGAANPITDSVQAVLGVGGCIVFFSVAASCICALLPGLPEYICACFQALLEIAGGMRAFSLIREASCLRLITMAALVGFGGFSILTQNHLFLQTCGITFRQLLLMALFRAIGAAAAMTLLVWFI